MKSSVNLGMKAIQLSGHESIHVNIVEVDDLSNDRYTGSISAKAWNIEKNCVPYEIKIALPTSAEKSVEQCFSISPSISAEIGASDPTGSVEATIGAEIGAEFNSCSSWIEPANSYIVHFVVHETEYKNSITKDVYACSNTQISKDYYGNPFSDVT